MRPGDVVSQRYELVELAGAGGMGVVFRAVDRQSGDTVALKVLSGDAEDRRRFTREARYLAGIHHPAIVEFLGHGDSEDGEPYIVMQWVTGESLEARLQRHGVTAREAIELVARIAEGVGELHRSAVIHRDIKPANILFADGNAPKLIDLGIARGVGDPISLTATGMQLGTPGYMAPEQARGDRDLDPRADVFALGCVLYECLTGQPAFAGEHPSAICAKILKTNPPPVRSVSPEVTVELEQLVMRMLAKASDERPADGAAVAAELAALPAIPEGPRRARIRDDAPTAVARPPGASGLSLFVVGEGGGHALPTRGEVSIGRAEDCAIRIEHKSVSRMHAMLRVGEYVTLEDLGSANGTRVRDRELPPHTPTRIYPGEPIYIGAVLVTLGGRW